MKAAGWLDFAQARVPASCAFHATPHLHPPTMFAGLKRALQRSPDSIPAAEGRELQEWVQARGLRYARVPDKGFVIEGQHAGTPWRMEWGPSKRGYMPGQELRVRAELGLPSDEQALVMTRRLAEKLEKSIFEKYVDTVQTRVDKDLPSEMRWLVMFPKRPGPEMGLLRDRFVALGSSRKWLSQWLDGPLSGVLAMQPDLEESPVVLMLGRGRLLLRVGLAEADTNALKGWLRVFETAVSRARRSAERSKSGGQGDWRTSVWNSLEPQI
jgi:hypothetical protein